MRDFDTRAEDISVDLEDQDGSSHSHSGISRVGVTLAPYAGSLEEAKWLVHTGGTDVFGPVSARQVAEAMKTGRLATNASIQASGEVFWTGLLEEPAVVAALKAT